MMLLANTPAQAKTLVHGLQRAVAGIGVYVNAHKREYMNLNQRGDISTLNGSSLKPAWNLTTSLRKHANELKVH